MASVVLVTGVASEPGVALALDLAERPGVERVIGVDVVPPRRSLAPAEFIRADVRGTSLSRLLDAYEVDTVVHAGVLTGPSRAGGRTAQKEINVIGTMQLLAACQRAERLTKLIVRSSTAVYGLSPRNPAVFTEDEPPRSPPGSGFAKDVVEVEGYTRGFARRRPDVTVTTLRLAYLLGDDSALGRYLTLPVVPTILGYDPRLQLLHLDDAVEALGRATVEEHPGTFNVAGDGVVTVSQAAHLAGRPTVPVFWPAVGGVARALRRARIVDINPELAATIMHAHVADTSRMRAEFGWLPSRSTRQALADHVAGAGLEPTVPVSLLLDRAEEVLRA
ncbi:MAG: NAD-dependent epimerase/dehydratase family protein [Streptosporangiales bacterium]|nr:NAD-dependent epimerase/dehydratase family protein [Streptosporangiales bacterium]